MSDGGGEVIFEGDTSFTDNVAEAAGGKTEYELAWPLS